MEKKSGSKKQVVFLVILVFLIGLFVAGYVVNSRPGGKKIIKSGDRAPEFKIQGSDGRYINLSDLRGNVVMVHFWATWCSPCVEEMPTLDKLYRTFMEKDLKILAVSVDEGGEGSVIPFMQKNHLNVPVFYDPDRSIAGLYGTFKFPETYIIDRQGMVRYKVIGSRDWSDPEAARVLRDLLAAR
jgi:cytochrome c biogenesis protein CcmG/thiol:disulfide interchange protein DsbE